MRTRLEGDMSYNNDYGWGYGQQGGQGQYSGLPEKKKGVKLKIVVGVVVVLLILSAIGGRGKSQGNNTSSPAPVATQPTGGTETQTPGETTPDQSVPTEYKNALTKAKVYSDTMHMSKQGIYDQLTSEYGEKFSPEAAQWAVDNLNANYNANALEKAKTYEKTMAMSPSAIHDQLMSEYGDKFTEGEAQYAVDHLND